MSFRRLRSPILAVILVALGSLVLAEPGRTAAPEGEEIFLVRTTAGKVVRGPLHSLAADWSVQVGKGVLRKVPGAEMVRLRQEGVLLPELPASEQLILVNGDRIPVREVRLDGEKLFFTHPGLEGGKETSIPLAAVAVFWRTGPDRTVHPEVARRKLVARTRGRDLVLLRNGDQLEGTLNALDARTVDIEADKKIRSARLSQVAAVALSSELADRLKPSGVSARLVLLPTDRSPGGRWTLTQATSDGVLLRGRTSWGAMVRVPLGNVVALDLAGGRAVGLSDLTPARYEHKSWLDLPWAWTADANVLGRDLRVGRQTYDKGVSQHSSSRLTYRLAGAYQHFEAVVGLDDREGAGGNVRIRVLGDGKPLEIPGKGDLTSANGPLHVQVSVAGVKELTLEVALGTGGDVRGVVDWVDAWLIK
jgi:hypothetical protein